MKVVGYQTQAYIQEEQTYNTLFTNILNIKCIDNRGETVTIQTKNQNIQLPSKL